MKNSSSQGRLKVIKILDPLLCVRCDYAYVADVVTRRGERKKMFYCSRLDCDNWVARSASATRDEDVDLAA